MIVGIVGSEAAKFTAQGKAEAERVIEEILADREVSEVVSGGCHLGGIDQWAIETAKKFGLLTTEFLPKHRSWTSYKARNMQIVKKSDVVHCITVKQLPANFVGMRFDLCYHCKTNDHIKSGGCWTMKQAIAEGKGGVLHVVPNE